MLCVPLKHLRLWALCDHVINSNDSSQHSGPGKTKTKYSTGVWALHLSEVTRRLLSPGSLCGAAMVMNVSSGQAVWPIRNLTPVLVLRILFIIMACQERDCLCDDLDSLFCQPFCVFAHRKPTPPHRLRVRAEVFKYSMDYRVLCLFITS